MSAIVVVTSDPTVAVTQDVPAVSAVVPVTQAPYAYSSLTGTPTLGTAASLNVGTAANQIVELNGSAKVPAVDGSLITNLTPANIAGLLTFIGSNIAGLIGGSVIIKKQSFTASGTYTPSAGMICATIECVGGGGGGGAAPTVASTTLSGSGGAGGNYARKLVTAADIGASKAVTVGSGGAGGVQGTSNGGAGTATSVGALCVANGGNGGSNSQTTTPWVNAPGSAGSAGTGDLLVNGEPGGYGSVSPSATVVPSGRGGGSGLLFGAGAGSAFSITTAVGFAGGSYGGAGSGGHAVTSNANGGAGASGVVFITEFCSL